MRAWSSDDVVAEKTRPPAVSDSLIPRAKLLRHLNEGMNQRGTLITAPAGFGKTYLVADWLAYHPEIAQSWVTLDPYDNDPMRFLLHVIDSVHREVPDLVGDGPSMIASRPADPSEIVDALASSLGQSSEHLILVIDDVHLVESAETLACLEACLNRLPSSVHLVMVGRHEPAIPLARRFAAGDINELRTTDLRMSLEETRMVVLESLGLEMSDVATTQLHRKTMGWVVGIRLAAAAAADQRDVAPDFAAVPSVGTDSREYGAVADYLFEEVLDLLDEQQKRFLVDTSVLTQLTPPLCEAVTGESGAQAMLERFVGSGLFTTRVDTPGRWYRYHDLFREALQSRLSREDPGRIADVHRRAAIWLHHHGSTVRAIEHAIEAGDSELADDWLVEAARPFIMAKQGRTLISLLRQLDAISPSLSPSALAGWMAVELSADGTSEGEIDSALVRLERRLSTTDSGDSSSTTQPWELLPLPVNESWDELLTVVRALLAYRRGNVEAMAASDGIPSESGVVEAGKGIGLMLLERYSEAEPLLLTYLDFANSPRNSAPSLRGRALGHLAELNAFAGNLAEAEQLATSGLDQLSDFGLGDRPAAMNAAIAAGWIAWERGQIDAAESSIANMIETIDRYGEMPSFVLAGILTARIRWSRGDHAEARHALDRVTVSPSGRVATGHFADRIALERARFALLEGNTVNAELAIPDWRQRIDRGPETMRHRLVLARMAISSGGDASVLLGVEPFDAEITVAHRIEIHKLRALAAMTADDPAGALNQLTQAMRLAAHTGHRQTFIDEQATFGALLDNAVARAGHRLSSEEQLEEPINVGEDARRPPIEPLSERELEILRLLPTQYTNREIGDQLSISPNTVKFHVRGIYRKLEADRRTEAVERARSLGLVP